MAAKDYLQINQLNLVLCRPGMLVPNSQVVNKPADSIGFRNNSIFFISRYHFFYGVTYI